MSNKINFTSSDILDKEFIIKPKGYDAEQVDEYLDQIIEDYREFESLDNKLKTEQKANSLLRKQLNDLELENEILNKKLGEYRINNSGANLGNIDLLKKISDLEQENYNLKKQIRNSEITE